MLYTRRELLQIAAAAPALGGRPALGASQASAPRLGENTGWAEHIPVRWIEPAPAQRRSGSGSAWPASSRRSRGLGGS